MAAKTPYYPPVEILLHHNSDPFILAEDPLPNYVQELGLTPADIPELARLAADAQFDNDPDDELKTLAPLRAAHALGQIASEAPVEAIRALISLFDQEARWYEEELIDIFTRVGPTATDYLIAYLNNETKPDLSRMYVQDCLSEIAQAYPETSDRFQRELVACLEKFEQNPPLLNGSIIAELIALEAVETAPLMEAAYQAERVDLNITGPWAAVQVDLGLKQKSDFRPEELEIPRHLRLELFQERFTTDLFNVLDNSAVASARPPAKGFGETLPSKKSNKKSKKKK